MIPVCQKCGSENLVAHYQADPKVGGYEPGDEVPSTLVGVDCQDCGAVQ